MDAADRGHRRGNFPNYYAFHPPGHRLDVLERAGLLDCLRKGLRRSDGEVARTPLGATREGAAGASVRSENDDRTSTNEEDVEEGVSDGSSQKKPRLDYSEPSAVRTIYYCDLGCNEGDLTMAAAKALAKPDAEGEEANVTIKCLGLDLDPMLIERANNKFSSGKEGVDATFKVCNLCSQSEHDEACSSFLRGIKGTTDDAEDATTESKRCESGPSHAEPRFHLTTIFSTTMWIHVHGGDGGLRAFLERACRWTERYLLIEPQPSGCYRKANVRLRKMGRPELHDVSSSRLKMRPEIEKEIEKVVLGCGFRRVVFDALVGNGDDSGGGEKRDVTSWNRRVHLYERI